MARARIEPHVENVGLLAECGPAAVGTVEALGEQFRGALFIPDIGSMPAEQSNDRIENLTILHRLLAAVAIENDDRHAPGPLARNTPVRTRGDHVGDALLAP